MKLTYSVIMALACCQFLVAGTALAKDDRPAVATSEQPTSGEPLAAPKKQPKTAWAKPVRQQPQQRQLSISVDVDVTVINVYRGHRRHCAPYVDTGGIIRRRR